MNPVHKHGFSTKEQYLEDLAGAYGIDYQTALCLGDTYDFNDPNWDVLIRDLFEEYLCEAYDE